MKKWLLNDVTGGTLQFQGPWVCSVYCEEAFILSFVVVLNLKKTAENCWNIEHSSTSELSSTSNASETKSHNKRSRKSRIAPKKILTATTTSENQKEDDLILPTKEVQLISTDDASKTLSSDFILPSTPAAETKDKTPTKQKTKSIS